MTLALPPAPLPSIGTRGFRVLDGLRFPCEVVKGVSNDPTTLSVRYLDDATVEHEVEPDEFETLKTTETSSTTTSVVSYDELVRPLDHQSCVLSCVASFLAPFTWLSCLIRVSRQWRTVLLKTSQWHSLHLHSHARLLPRLLDVRLDGGTGCARDSLEHVVLDDSDVIDDHVVMITTACPQLQAISLRRCQHLTFMVVYELLRLARERRAAGKTLLKYLDLWLCRGVSPTFVAQLQTPQRRLGGNCHGIDIRGPGFFFVDAPASVFTTLQEHTTTVQQWPKELSSVLWFPESMLLEMAEQARDDPSWQSIQRHVPLLKVASVAGIVPLVRFDDLIEPRHAHDMCLGIPANTLVDLSRLIHDTVPCHATRNAAMASLEALTATDAHDTTTDTIEDDPLAAEAARVFALLRQTTEQLQEQVDRLETQVAVMADAKAHAEHEYKHAQRELQRVAQEADRAVLRLATSTDDNIDKPPQNGVVQHLPEDDLLPPLPSSETIASLAETLEREWFVVLDDFVGLELSSKVRADAKRMYQTSRAADYRPAGQPPPAPARFALGELAGGHTGRNLRYQMAHVRGDYMLWLDEHDACCPQSIRFVLRQLDRLILEHLSVVSHELSMSALLRKKAMITCYPGQRKAGYTRHCDNPNRNGRRLTAILYLNPDWDIVLHGGALRLYRDRPKEDTASVAPLLDRLLLFYSDARVPHEVLPCQDATRDRFALTVWYLDYDEYMHAQVFGTTKDEASERRRIEQEIERLGR